MTDQTSDASTPTDASSSPSIYEHLAAHLRPDGPGLLEGGEQLPDETPREGAPDGGTVRWAPGALDGVMARHLGHDDGHEQADTLFDLILESVGSDLEPGTYQRLHRALEETSVLDVVDTALERVHQSSMAPAVVHELGRRLALTSAHREPVKCGIALLGPFEYES